MNPVCDEFWMFTGRLILSVKRYSHSWICSWREWLVPVNFFRDIFLVRVFFRTDSFVPLTSAFSLRFFFHNTTLYTLSSLRINHFSQSLIATKYLVIPFLIQKIWNVGKISAKKWYYGTLRQARDDSINGVSTIGNVECYFFRFLKNFPFWSYWDLFSNRRIVRFFFLMKIKQNWCNMR